MGGTVMLIKVKYGDTIRRFSCPVDDFHELEIDMDGLRDEICSLFSVSPDADLTLTYIDEDGDNVLLVDDGDLCGAVDQNLDSLRINVVLNNDNKGGSSSNQQQQQQQPLPNINSVAAEILKSLTEPLPQELLKLFLDFASKSSSSKSVAELVSSASKMALNGDSGASGSSNASKDGDDERPEVLAKNATSSKINQKMDFDNLTTSLNQNSLADTFQLATNRKREEQDVKVDDNSFSGYFSSPFEPPKVRVIPSERKFYKVRKSRGF